MVTIEEKEKKIDHEGCFQAALLLQSTTKEGGIAAFRGSRKVWKKEVGRRLSES